MLPDRAETLLGGAEPFVRLLALGVLLHFAQGPPHGRPQPGQPLLEHVIRGAVLQGLDGCLLAQGAGDEEEGGLGTFLLCGRESGQAVVGRKRVVGQDEVGGEVAELRPGNPLRS